MKGPGVFFVYLVAFSGREEGKNQGCWWNPKWNSQEQSGWWIHYYVKNKSEAATGLSCCNLCVLQPFNLIWSFLDFRN